jgi:hypothetical protein
MRASDQTIVAQRVKIILYILFLSRSLYSETTMPDGSKVSVADVAKESSIHSSQLPS